MAFAALLWTLFETSIRSRKALSGRSFFGGCRKFGGRPKADYEAVNLIPRIAAVPDTDRRTHTARDDGGQTRDLPGYFTNSLTPTSGLGLLASPRGQVFPLPERWPAVLPRGFALAVQGHQLAHRRGAAWSLPLSNPK